MVDPLEGCIAETLEFDIRPGTLLKDVGFELTTLNTGLLVKDAPCLEFLEGTGLLSAFSLSSTLCNIDPSSLRDCEILKRQTSVLEIYCFIMLKYITRQAANSSVLQPTPSIPKNKSF